MTNRVVITGMGGISSIGMSVSEIYQSFREGKSGITQLEFPDVSRLKVKTGGQIKNYDPSNHFELKKLGRTEGRVLNISQVKFAITPWCNFSINKNKLDDLNDDDIDVLIYAITKSLKEVIMNNNRLKS